MRRTLAIVAGIVVAFALIAAIDNLGHRLYPLAGMPAVDDRAAMRTYIAAMAPGAKAFAVLAWLVAAFCGPYLAARLARGATGLATAIVGGVVLAAVVANLVMLPHPLWMNLAGGVGVPLLAWLAARLAGRQ
jgi:hypothetical protein